MPAEVRRKVLRYFFENGVIVVGDDQAAVHEEIGVLNIYAYQIGRSFVSRGFAKKQYAWTHAYYILNDDGIEYLRGYFGVPANAAPLTLAPQKLEFLERQRTKQKSVRIACIGFAKPGHGKFARASTAEAAELQSINMIVI